MYLYPSEITCRHYRRRDLHASLHHLHRVQLLSSMEVRQAFANGRWVWPRVLHVHGCEWSRSAGTLPKHHRWTRDAFSVVYEWGSNEHMNCRGLSGPRRSPFHPHGLWGLLESSQHQHADHARECDNSGGGGGFGYCDHIMFCVHEEQDTEGIAHSIMSLYQTVALQIIQLITDIHFGLGSVDQLRLRHKLVTQLSHLIGFSRSCVNHVFLSIPRTTVSTPLRSYSWWTMSIMNARPSR